MRDGVSSSWDERWQWRKRLIQHGHVLIVANLNSDSVPGCDVAVVPVVMMVVSSFPVSSRCDREVRVTAVEGSASTDLWSRAVWAPYAFESCF